MGNHDQEESGSIHALIHSSANIEQLVKPDYYSHGIHRGVYLFFTYRNMSASVRTIKAARNMVIARMPPNTLWGPHNALGQE